MEKLITREQLNYDIIDAPASESLEQASLDLFNQAWLTALYVPMTLASSGVDEWDGDQKARQAYYKASQSTLA